MRIEQRSTGEEQEVRENTLRVGHSAHGLTLWSGRLLFCDDRLKAEAALATHCISVPAQRALADKFRDPAAIGGASLGQSFSVMVFVELRAASCGIFRKALRIFSLHPAYLCRFNLAYEMLLE